MNSPGNLLVLMVCHVCRDRMFPNTTLTFFTVERASASPPPPSFSLPILSSFSRYLSVVGCSWERIHIYIYKDIDIVVVQNSFFFVLKQTCI